MRKDREAQQVASPAAARQASGRGRGTAILAVTRHGQDAHATTADQGGWSLQA
ncbi:MAG TPA: hypothetical protein VMO17_03485 [Terriglobia bacterium]|nr:hypothetical protein [Terriglobia bacterium]